MSEMSEMSRGGGEDQVSCDIGRRKKEGGKVITHFELSEEQMDVKKEEGGGMSPGIYTCGWVGARRGWLSLARWLARVARWRQ
jgi:hypothetical protein